MFTRGFYISVLILTVFSIVCTQIPLLNYLGFEFSAATVLLAGIVSGVLTISFFKEKDFESKSELWGFIGKIYSAQTVLLLIPLLLSLANAILVKNCSIEDGLFFYSFIVIPGVFFSCGLAIATTVVFKKMQTTIFTILFILILLHIPIVGLFKPQIYAFNLILGFFPGFTYDETLDITRRLIIFRFQTLAVAGFLLTMSIWIWQFKKRKQRRFAFPILETAIMALFLPIILVVILFSERFGFSSSEKFIRQKLAGNYKTEHFEIIYPAGSVKRERIRQIGKLHEFYLSELNKELDISSINKVKTFIYSSPEQKGKLIGASYTNIAKPWLRQIHINISDLEASLKHEMTHVIAADFGWSPLRIGKNSGLTEGLAMALERASTTGSSLHHTAALIFAAGLNPDVAALFSFGNFALQNASVSYNIVGSFSRYLIDTRGIELFKKLYNTGDFENIYGVKLSNLITEWRASLKKISLSNSEIIKAQFLFRRPSIFGKECARVLANLNNEAKQLLNQHEFEQALEIVERSLSLSKTPEAINRKAGALFELRLFRELIEFAETQMQDSTINFLLLPLRLRLGDAYWAMDSLVKAKSQYEMLEATHLSEWYDEICSLRIEALKDRNNELRQFFIYSMEDTIRIARLEKFRNPLARFLLAREYAGKGRYADCINELIKIDLTNMGKLEYFRLRHLGIAYYSVEEFKLAKDFFKKAMFLAPSSISELNTREWIHRCEFEESYPAK